MPTSAPPPKLPAWIFYASDLALLAAAVFIAAQTPRPLPNSAIFAIVACVIAGAILATIPRLVEYEREKNAALDERQSALEGLSQTIANSAEQISAAATGLHTIAELTHKNLRHAEQLPHKLQEKIAEFQAQLANAGDTEKEELEKELAALRSSESERLESVSDRVAKSVAEFARLQTQLQKQLAAGSAALTPPTASPAPAATAFSTPPIPKRAREPAVPGATPAVFAAPEATRENSVAPFLPSSLPQKPARPPRRDEAQPGGFANPVTSVTAREIPPDEPAPVKPHEIAPVVPDSHSPYPEHVVANAKIATTHPFVPASAGTTPPTPAPQPARKRAEKKNSETPAENLLGFEISDAPDAPEASASKPATIGALVSEFAQLSPEEINPAPALAADGATRLLVTAYIGIGNRLFIRGEGPGLSWEKGIPLHFVSIGKWRWEAANVVAPVQFKLYKNDETECASLGLQTLAPGHQQELSAAF
jgi:hypothetical protein